MIIYKVEQDVYNIATMSNIEVYEANLKLRLEELRCGDQAYDLHERALSEAIVFSNDLGGENDHPKRILDVGCGLGFMTAKLAEIGIWEVVGIDLSEKAISLARKEHEGVTFYQASVELFPEMMPGLNEKPFSQVILNMVFHSVDDEAVSTILAGARQCLRPEGTVILVVPTSSWLMQKLIEYVQDQGMEREDGIIWVQDQLRQREIELPVKIRGGEYYPHTLTVFNRQVEDYGRLLRDNNFGVIFERFDEDGETTSSQIIPYWEPKDYMSNYELNSRRRSVLVSFAL